MSNKKKIWILLGLLSIIFHIFLIFSGLIPNLISRPLHMALAIPWVFIYRNQIVKHFYLNFALVLTGIFFCLAIIESFGFAILKK